MCFSSAPGYSDVRGSEGPIRSIPQTSSGSSRGGPCTFPGHDDCTLCALLYALLLLLPLRLVYVALLLNALVLVL